MTELKMRKLMMVVLLGGMAMQPSHARTKTDEVTRTIEVHVKRFAFSPSEVVLKKGETVDIRLISEDVSHSLFLPDLGINLEVSKGNPQDVIITPQAVGDFLGQCGRFCGSGHGMMKFTVHVTD
jgi:cytochrome c oxidase subunit 2